jgi:hypothetical protein
MAKRSNRLVKAAVKAGLKYTVLSMLAPVLGLASVTRALADTVNSVSSAVTSVLGKTPEPTVIPEPAADAEEAASAIDGVVDVVVHVVENVADAL